MSELDEMNAVPDGAAILDEVRATLVRYVAFPSSEAADATTVYVAATHAQSAWEHATRFLAKSPEKRCGKSRLLEVMRELVHRPRSTVNISAAALVRSIDQQDPPTLLVDEADRLYGSRVKADVNEDLTGILDVGFARDWPYTRYNASTNKTEDHPTFAMAILASKGVDLPDTIEDRSIVVTMRRRAPGETVSSFRRKNVPELVDLRERIEGWVRSRLADLEDAEPPMPVEDRAADCWESLVAVADLAGGGWPQRIRHACKVMVADAETADSEASYGARLLTDIRDTFATMTVFFLESRELVNQLKSIEDAPWRDMDLTPRGLSDRLRRYAVRPRHNSAKTARGYRLEDFADAFSRYIPEGSPSETVQVSVNGSDQQKRTDTSEATDTVKCPSAQTVRSETAGHPPDTDGRTLPDAPPAEPGQCHREGHGWHPDGCPLDKWPEGSIGADENREATA